MAGQRIEKDKSMFNYLLGIMQIAEDNILMYVHIQAIYEFPQTLYHQDTASGVL